MSCLMKIMTLAFEARQNLYLSVPGDTKRLPEYLMQEDRLVKALLDSKQLNRISAGRYEYVVTSPTA